MAQEIYIQAGNILEGMWYGIWIAAAYDVLRILRRVIRFGTIQVNLQDFLFWVAVGLVLFSMMFQCTDGVVRFYLFLSVFTGAWLYHKSVSAFLVKYLSKIINKLFTILLKKPWKWGKICVMWLKTSIKGGNKKHGKYNDQKKKKGEARDLYD